MLQQKGGLECLGHIEASKSWHAELHRQALQRQQGTSHPVPHASLLSQSRTWTQGFRVVATSLPLGSGVQFLRISSATVCWVLDGLPGHSGNLSAREN